MSAVAVFTPCYPHLLPAWRAADPRDRQTGGAKTAGPTYTTNQRTMLQTVYTALQTFGLLS
jgi:hypothetical protein